MKWLLTIWALLFCQTQFLCSATSSELHILQDEDALARELQKSRESAQEAVKKGRETQEKLSLSENIRKAEEKKEKDRMIKLFQPIAIAILILILGVRILWIKRSKDT
ncbi:MAG: hypothetical protein FWG02_09930 [Holophagaceae bacterium]|nr:hypothetical protein [Holophagaceae bacterium]